MRCPNCQGEMEAGYVDMKMPFLSLNFGLSSKDLYFTATNGSKHRILRPRDRTEAQRCGGCGAVVIPSKGNA